MVERWTAILEIKVQIPALPPTFFPRQAFFTHPLNDWKMSSKLLSILLLLFVPFPMHGIVQYDYKAFFLPYNFGHLYTWTFTISKIVTQASLVEISDKTFAVRNNTSVQLDMSQLAITYLCFICYSVVAETPQIAVHTVTRIFSQCCMITNV